MRPSGVPHRSPVREKKEGEKIEIERVREREREIVNKTIEMTIINYKPRHYHYHHLQRQISGHVISELSVLPGLPALLRL